MTQPTFLSYLEDLELTEEHRSFVITVATMVTPLLHWMPRSIPQYTDHGMLHSVNVLRYLRDLIRTYPFNFTEEEKFLLALSSILHDLGCLTGKNLHNEKTVRILRKTQFELLRYNLDPVLVRSLEEIILAHSSDFNLNSVSDDPIEEIRLKIICSLFRLADACDISSLRVKRILLEILEEEGLLEEEHIKYWKSHLAIENITIKGTNIRKYVYDSDKAELYLSHFDNDLEKINKILREKGLPMFTQEIIKVEDKIVDDI